MTETNSVITNAALEPSAKIPLRTWIGFAVLLTGQFMAVLDIQIVASSLGEIRASLGATVEEIAWIQSAYLIAEVIMIPLSAWLARVFSMRYMFAGSTALFTVSSVLCALAWNLESMTVFRGLQGFFSGCLVPLSFATIFFMFPREKHGIAVILAGMITTSGITMGPVVGGWVTQNYSWPWIFLMNIPIGILVVTGVLMLIDIDKPQIRLLRRVDIGGVILVALFLGSFQFLLSEGPKEDWFESELIFRVTVVMLIAGILFVWRELTCPEPVIDLRIFRYQRVTITCICAFFLGAAIYGSTYLMPAMLSTVRAYNSEQIGTIMMFTGIAQVTLAPFASYMNQRLPSRIILALGLTFLIASLFAFSTSNAEVGMTDLALPQFTRGIGMMLCFLPLTLLAIGGLPLSDVRMASSVYNLSRSLGGAIGLALLTSFQDYRFDFHKNALAERLTVDRVQITDALVILGQRVEQVLGPGEHIQSLSLKLLTKLVDREAWVLTFNDMWIYLALYSGLSMIFIPFLKELPPITQQAAARTGPVSGG